MLKLRLEVVKHIFNVTQLANGWAWIWTQVSEWKLCPTLCDLMDCSLPSSSVCGILQARILEWVGVPFSRGSSQLKNWTQVSHIAGGFFTSWAIREIFPIPKPGVLSTALCSQGLALLLFACIDAGRLPWACGISFLHVSLTSFRSQDYIW